MSWGTMYKIIMANKRDFFSVFGFYLLLIFTFIFTHHTFLGVQDEAHLQATLKAANVMNYMTSYPLAKIVGYLYLHFPSIQWYSVMMIFYIILTAFVMAIYVAILRVVFGRWNLLYKAILFILFTLLIIYMLLMVDVTTPTLLLIVLGIPLIRQHQLGFWILFWIASFLREQILFSVMPLILLAYIIQFDKQYFITFKRIIMVVLLFGGVLFNHFSYKMDKEYDDWMTFTQKRAFFTDFGGKNEKNILTREEFDLSRTWWILDLDLYPYKKVEKAAGSTIDIVKERVLYEDPKKLIKNIFLRHPSLYALLFISILMAILYKSWLRFLVYGVFTSGFIILMMVKDVERVTFPIILLWWMLMYLDIKKLQWKYKSVKYIILVMLFSWLTVYAEKVVPWERITAYNQKEKLFYEFKDIIARNHMELEITTGFPSSWEKLIEAIMQNHLFDESNWIDYTDELFLNGWLTKNPLCYKEHHISYDGVRRKYAHYHDWLMADNTGIIGSKGEKKHIRPFLISTLMELYDEKFPQKGCEHVPVVVDQSKHFIIHKIGYKCTGINSIYGKEQNNVHIIWDFNKDGFKQTHMFKIENNFLVSTGNDPWMILDINQTKLTSKYIIIDIEIEQPYPTVFQVFYKKNVNEGYTETQTYTRTLHKGNNHLRLSVPTIYMKNGLRIDPLIHSGKYKLNKFMVYTNS